MTLWSASLFGVQKPSAAELHRTLSRFTASLLRLSATALQFHVLPFKRQTHPSGTGSAPGSSNFDSPVRSRGTVFRCKTGFLVAVPHSLWARGLGLDLLVLTLETLLAGVEHGAASERVAGEWLFEGMDGSWSLGLQERLCSVFLERPNTSSDLHPHLTHTTHTHCLRKMFQGTIFKVDLNAH